MENAGMNTDPASNPSVEPTQATGLDAMLQHLLENNLQQQAVTQELAQSL